jgi:hypothetical protein
MIFGAIWIPTKGVFLLHIHLVFPLHPKTCSFHSSSSSFLFPFSPPRQNNIPYNSRSASSAQLIPASFHDPTVGTTSTHAKNHFPSTNQMKKK